MCSLQSIFIFRHALLRLLIIRAKPIRLYQVWHVGQLSSKQFYTFESLGSPTVLLTLLIVKVHFIIENTAHIALKMSAIF
jgi:hypothetical protein